MCNLVNLEIKVLNPKQRWAMENSTCLGHRKGSGIGDHPTLKPNSRAASQFPPHPHSTTSPHTTTHNQSTCHTHTHTWMIGNP